MHIQIRKKCQNFSETRLDSRLEIDRYRQVKRQGRSEIIRASPRGFDDFSIK